MTTTFRICTVGIMDEWKEFDKILRKSMLTWPSDIVYEHYFQPLSVCNVGGGTHILVSRQPDSVYYIRERLRTMLDDERWRRLYALKENTVTP